MNRQRELHDKLLAIKKATPELAGAVHDETVCFYCSAQGGVVGYTEEQVRDMIEQAQASAVAPLLAQLAELKQAQLTGEVESLVAAAKAEASAELETVRAQLDEAVLKATAAEAELDAFKAEVEQARLDAEAAEELQTTRNERLAQVREVASFPDDYLDKNADRWAVMDAESFDHLLGEYKTLSGKDPGKIPSKTALVASRELDIDGDPDGKKLYREVMQRGLIEPSLRANNL